MRPWVIAAGPPTVHPTLTSHSAGDASLPSAGDVDDKNENVSFLANEEDGVEEEESDDGDGGIAEVAEEVAEEVVQAKDIF